MERLARAEVAFMILPDITELQRLPSPAPLPQSLAFDGQTLWMGSRETCRMYAIDPRRWTARDEGEAPGTPWGLTVAGDELRAVCGETSDDHRFVRRFIPGRGWTSRGKFACPDDTGSYLGFDGERLYLTQWYRKQIISLDEAGNVGSTIAVPHQICGCVIVEGRFFLVTTDDENTSDYWVTRVDARGPTPVFTDLVRIGFAARSLAFDGERFWTNHRERNEIVAFAAPADI
jgi:hypothetical protein